MWVTKLLIFPVEIRIFCPKTTKFGPKLAFLINLGQAMQAYSMPCCESVGGCGARAVSRKTRISLRKGYFNFSNMLSWAHISLAGSFGALLVGWLVVVVRGLYIARHLFTLLVNLDLRKKNTLFVSEYWDLQFKFKICN